MTRAIIFANGEFDAALASATLARIQDDDFLIAADGGAKHCFAMGLMPQIIIGDMDSIDERAHDMALAHGTELIGYPEQKDETDLELAVQLAVARKFDSICIVNALGGRLDMTLANLLMLAHPHLGASKVELWHGNQSAWLLAAPGSSVQGSLGDSLSLIALGAEVQHISSLGLLYPLHNESLFLGVPRGVSNVMTEREAHIRFAAGLLCVVHTKSPS